MNRFREDRGATMILITASLLVLFGFVAIVVDGGLGFSERRQAQSGADFAALASLQEAVSCPSPCTEQAAADNGAAEVILRVEGNLPGRYTAAEWLACTDTARPAKFSIVSSDAGGGTECVSFTKNFDEARVMLPNNQIDTTFAKVIGFDTLTVGAFAEAGQVSKIRVSAIPHTPNGTAGSEACLLSDQAPQTVEPCSGAASGFYGYLDVALFGDDEVGTPSTCINGDTNKRIAINMAKGSDHNLVEYDLSPPDPLVNDHDACPNTSEDVNQMRVETGSPTGALENGLFNGVSGSINGEPITATPGRLTCDTATYSDLCAVVRGRTIDHTGLWEYWTGGCGGTAPTNHDSMKTCLEHATPPTFSGDILNNPRFAAIPIFHDVVDGPGDYTIKEFIPVWLEKTFYDCNATKCDTVHSPGEIFDAFSPPGNPTACPATLTSDIDNCGWLDTGSLKLGGLTAFMLDVTMLPADVQEVFPGVRSARIYNLTE